MKPKSQNQRQNVNSPTTTAPTVKSTKAFFLRKVLTSALLRSSTFFLAFMVRMWMFCRRRATGVRARGVSPVLLVMVPQCSRPPGWVDGIQGGGGYTCGLSKNKNKNVWLFDGWRFGHRCWLVFKPLSLWKRRPRGSV